MSAVGEITAGRNKRSRVRGYAPWKPQARARATLANVEQVLETYQAHLPMSVRQILYALIGRDQAEKGDYEHLLDVMNRARRAGMIDFEAIRDDGISVIEPVTYTGIEDFHEETAIRARNYERDKQAAQPYYIELYCEAAGMIPQVARGVKQFSIPVYSGGGFDSTTARWEVAQRVVERNVPTVLLHLGDRDNYGDSIVTAWAEDIVAYVERDRPIQTIKAIPVTVALTAEQVEEYSLPTQPAKGSERSGRPTCQLEALPPDILAGLIREAVAGWFDADIYHDHRETEVYERAELLGLPAGGET